MFDLKDQKLIRETIRLVNEKAQWTDLSSSDAVVLYNCFLFLEGMHERINKDLELQEEKRKQLEAAKSISQGEVAKNEGTVKPKPSRRKKVSRN